MQLVRGICVKTAAIRLPRRRFFKLRGNIVELAVGLLAASLLQANAAHAEAMPAAGGSDPVPPPGPLPESLQGVDPDAIRTMSIDELKQLLDAKTLAALGLDASFPQMLDTDAAGAIRKLETAFREKIKVAAKGESKIASADAHGDAGAHHAEEAGARDVAGDHDGGHGFSPLYLLGGLALVGGGIAAAAGGGGGGGGSAPNVAPVATNDAVTTNEDAPVTFDVRTNDSDRDGGTLAVTQINGTAITTTSPVAITGGTISLGADGRLTFTPSANFNGTPSFTYTISDGQGGTATATVNLTVTAVNDAPVAANDSFTTAEDAPVEINVRANDSDVDGDTLTVTQVNGTAITTTTPVAVTGGVVSLNAAGNLVFTPTANFNGTPSFTYTVSDGKGGTSTATVNGTVTAVNDAPVNALPASIAPIAQGASAVIPGLSVSDVDGDGATFTTRLSVTNGTLSAAVVANGAVVSNNGTGTITLTGTLAQVNATLAAITYTGAPGFAGAETLTIVTSDGQATDTDTLAITVAQVTTGTVIDGYVAGARIFFDANGNGTYDEGEVVATTDANGRFVLVGEPRGTMIALGGINTDTGLPNLIALKAPAGSTAVTPLTTLLAELVESGVDLTTAMAQTLRAFGLPEGLDLTAFDFLSADADPTLAFAVQKVATQIASLLIQANEAGISSTAIGEQLAQLALRGAPIDLGDVALLGSLLVSAGADPAAAEAIALKAAAINQAIAAATSPADLVDTFGKLLQPGADLPPVTAHDSLVTDEDKALTFDVRTNDADPEGGALTVVKINGLSIAIGGTIAINGGTLTLGDDGRLTFQPNADFHGNPSFAYTVADAAGNQTDGSADITVNAVNDAPVATPDLVRFGLGVGGVVDVRLNDRDVDGDALRVTAINGTAITADQPVAVANGTVSLDAEGRLVFTPDAGFFGEARFEYTVSDGNGGFATSTVTAGLDGPILPVAADQLGFAADQAGALAAAGITTLDVAGDVASLNHTQAEALIAAGIDFAEADDITLTVEGTTLDTSLKSLQSLHVDTIAVRAGVAVLAVEAGGSLASITGDDLPRFNVAQSDAALDVTLNVDGGTLDPALDLAGLAGELRAAGIDHVGVNGTGALTLDVAQAQALSVAGLDFASQADITLDVDAAQVATLDPAMLERLNIDHIDASGPVTISDAQAQALVGASVDFVEADDVTVTAEGTTMSTSLKALQSLHVDAIKVAPGITALSLMAGGSLEIVSAEGLPSFTALQSDASLDVTLTVDGGTLSPTLDLAGLATELREAGIDHLGVNGAGLSLDLPQAQALATAGLDFAQAADITLDLSVAQVGDLATTPGLLSALHVDHLDADGPVSINEAQAQALIGAGVDFVEADDVTVSVEGTEMSTSLKSLQSLHVDAVKVATGVTALTIMAGGGLETVSAADLPSFTVHQTNAALDVTLQIDAGTLDRGLDLGLLAPALATSGIDHIGVAGNGELGVSYQQALDVADGGLNFSIANEVVVHLAAGELASVVQEAGTLASAHVDTIDMIDNVASIDDGQAASLIAAGLHFADADYVTVEAQGTEMSTSLRGLHDLKVDAITVAAGISALTVDAGDLTGLSASDLPQFDAIIKDADLDVTLRVDAGELGELARLAGALREAGIDHIVTNQDLATLTTEQADELAAITKATGIDFAYADFQTVAPMSIEAAAPHTEADLVAELRAGYEGPDDDGTGGVYKIADGAHHALAESGLLRAYTADTLVIDGTEATSDKLLTTLKDIADMGIDEVRLAGQGGAPVYIDLGLANEGKTDIQALFRSLEHGQDGPDPIFHGAEKVALVIDAEAAHALAEVDGAVEQLKAIGFTEIDVLADASGDTPPAFGDAGLEVKVIGQDDALYHHLQDR